MQYKVVNSATVNYVTKTEVNGQPAEIHQNRLVVELVPDDGVSGTIKLVLPADGSQEFPQNANVEVTFTVAGE